jgi:hypothetical protein
MNTLADEVGWITTPYSEYPRSRSAQLAAARAVGWMVAGQDGDLEHSPRHRSDNRPWVGADGARIGSFGLTLVPTLEALQRGYVGMSLGLPKHLAVTYAFAPCGARLHACYTAPPLIHRGRNTGGTDEYDNVCLSCYESEVLGMARLTDAEKETVAYVAAGVVELQAIVDHFGTDGTIPMYRTQIPAHCFR